MDLFEQRNIAPMLIAENKPAFDSGDYTYELKLDGVRCIAYLDHTGIALHNKRDKIVTPIYPEIIGAYKQLKDKYSRCILDGELFIYEEGRTNFAEMQRRSLMGNPFRIKLAAEKQPVTFTAFDILYLDGEQLTSRPLTERMEHLRDVVDESDRLSIPRTVEEHGTALYQAAAERSLEGIVAKRKDSRYYFGKRTKDWIKCKALMDEDFVVCGYYFKAENLISIILGSCHGKHLVYQGHVVMGVSRQDFQKMKAADISLKNDYYTGFPDFDDAAWLKPQLVCKVEYMERTKNGGLRHPVFRGLRDDKEPWECKMSNG